MLKNELEILTSILSRRVGGNAVNKKNGSDLSRVIAESCSRAREAWAAAAFSDVTDEALCRYFNFYVSYLNGLIAGKVPSGYPDEREVLYNLMDHLLQFYRKFIDPCQWVAGEYIAYRIRLLEPKYLQFIGQLRLFNTDKEFWSCISESLAPVYKLPAAEPMTLAALYYREELMMDLAAKRNSPELMTNESLIAFNFNHARFFDYLRKRSLKRVLNLRPGEYAECFAELIAAVPLMDDGVSRSFDWKWPHISVMYRDWLNDYRALLRISSPAAGDGVSCFKVRLNISVKQLACIIRALYQSGFYGTVSLTAIFEHAAAVFSTKRQEHISAESISNAYYALEQSSSLKTVRMLGSAVDFLKPYCFPA